MRLRSVSAMGAHESVCASREAMGAIDKPREILGWILAGTVGALLLIWAFPRAFPFYPADWQTSRSEATALALERLRDLGPPVPRAYVVASFDLRSELERRLILALAEGHDANELRESRAAEMLAQWVITVYAPGALAGEWTYRARISTRGRVLGLEMRLAQDEANAAQLGVPEARRRAALFLIDQGLDLEQFEEPVVRRKDLAARTDIFLNYGDREAALGERYRYGVEVSFAGDRLTGYTPWFEDPDARQIQGPLRRLELASMGWIWSVFLLLPVVGVVFLRRYHEGLIGIGRGKQIFVVLLVASLLTVLLTTRSATEGLSFASLTRAQVAWVWGLQLMIIYFAGVTFLGFFSWSAGESLCREQWGDKLAAFGALFEGRWGNATVASSSLRGTVCGVLLAALMVAVTLPLGKVGAWVQVSFLFGPWWEGARWPGVALLAVGLVFTLSYGLFGRLFLLTQLVGRLGPWRGGALVAVVLGTVFQPSLVVLPVISGLPLSALFAGALVALFLRYDLLTTLLSGLVSQVLMAGFCLLLAHDPSLQAQGWIAALGASLPLLVSLRHLGSKRHLTYRYDEVPPHVRRIAERERQRVELETARRIQSSILPQLPSRIAGVEIAHSYQPATEVGGDFYDVLPLADGRLAIAVGDVAGHGVSSGLVMCMARSALAVQVGFKPEVADVFATLNRVVFESAQKRLLTTLCYALLDPVRRSLVYASAGHLFPYQVSRVGQVSVLESVAYPLGVRESLEVEPKTADLDPGDSLFLASDGVVEGRANGELFGFQRLEESLARHAGDGALGLRDGVLEDLRHFVVGPPHDDLTVLVLKVP